MTPAEQRFHSIGENLEGSIKGQLFGKQCYKINGKAYCCFFENEMVFKLNGEIHCEALSFDGSQLFDPSKKGRAMKEWVQVPFDYQEKWEEFAEVALGYCS